MSSGILWVAVGFLGNGFAQFLQKYLHVAGLGDYQRSALIVMYAAGALFALGLMVKFGGSVSRREIAAGIGVGACSYLGNFSTLRALGYLPSYTVFPLIVGGPVVVVALYSRLFYGERLSPRVNAGIVCGVAAIILLALG